MLTQEELKQYENYCFEIYCGNNPEGLRDIHAMVTRMRDSSDSKNRLIGVKMAELLRLMRDCAALERDSRKWRRTREQVTVKGEKLTRYFAEVNENVL